METFTPLYLKNRFNIRFIISQHLLLLIFDVIRPHDSDGRLLSICVLIKNVSFGPETRGRPRDKNKPNFLILRFKHCDLKDTAE